MASRSAGDTPRQPQLAACIASNFNPHQTGDIINALNNLILNAVGREKVVSTSCATASMSMANHTLGNATVIASMNVKRLKQELANRSLPVYGAKPALVERLQQALDWENSNAQSPPLSSAAGATATVSAGGEGQGRLAATVMLRDMCDLLIKGDIKLIKLWLDAGVSVDVSDEDGWTPLLMACEAGHEALAKVLLGQGADKDKASKIGSVM